VEPFVGEITLFAFGKTPQGWLPCNGQVLDIRPYMTLASLIGTTYGGNGVTTFALPDLRGRVVVNQGSSTTTPSSMVQPYQLGMAAGTESVTLTTAHIPSHSHNFQVVNVAPNTDNPTNVLLAQANSNLYASGSAAAVASTLVTLNSGSASIAGVSYPHENRQPSLALQFCIATVGIYPSRP